MNTTTIATRPGELGAELVARTNISGVPELLPVGALLLESMTAQVRTVFRLHGGVPMYTGAFERLSTLRRKAGSTGKEIYTVGRANAAHDRETEADPLALRFDHTVPLARYVAQNHNNLAFPFVRYAVGPVWRGERPQSGRYREFVQADLDMIGMGTLPHSCDAEAVVALVASLRAIRAPRFVVGINNRKVLEQLMLAGGVAPVNVLAVLHEFDALPKPHVGVEAATRAMVAAGSPEPFARRLCEFAVEPRTDASTFSFIDELSAGRPELAAAAAELREVVNMSRTLGVPPETARADLSVVRALDYYSGTIFEAKLVEYPAEGSIAAGGRYDNLVEDLALDRTKLRHSFPGVGFSIGLTRLFVVLGRLGKLPKPTGEQVARRILILCRAEKDLERNRALSGQLREAGIDTLAYPIDKEFHQQLTYAKRSGFTELMDLRGDLGDDAVLELQEVSNPANRRAVRLSDLLG